MAEYIKVCGSILSSTARHWYLCGSDVGLRLDAMRLLRSKYSDSSMSYFDGELDAIGNIVDSILYPVQVTEDQEDTVVVENAGEVDFSFLQDYKSQEISTNLIVSGRTLPVKSSYESVNHFFRRDWAKVLVCNYRSEDDLARWVEIRADVSKVVALEMCRLSAGDTVWLADMIERLCLLNIGQSLTPKSLHKVVSASNHGDIVKNLIKGDKASSLRSIPSRTEARKAVRRLEKDLLKGSLFNEVQKNVGWQGRLLAERTKLSASEIKFFQPIVNLFGRQDVERRLSAIIHSRSGLEAGIREDWLKLISVW